MLLASLQKCRRLTRPVRLGLLAGVALCGVVANSEANEGHFLPLKIRFWADEIELTGAVPDQKTADHLLIAVRQSHPGMPTYGRLVIDPSRTVINLPDSKDLAGLLLELALSTKDGSLKVTNEAVTVSGLSDSLVTHAAFEARLNSLASRNQQRDWRNRICLVHEDDLVADSLPKRPRPALNPRPLDEIPVVLADNEYGPTLPKAEAEPKPLRAMPLNGLVINARNREDSENALIEAPTPDVLGTETTKAAPVTPAIEYEPAETIRFASNSYLVGFDQYRLVDEITEKIQALPEDSARVVVEAYPDHVGQHDFNQWLSKSRAESVLRALAEAGISSEQLRVVTRDGRKDLNHLGTVRFLLPKPVIPVAELEPEIRENSLDTDNSEESTEIQTSVSASPLSLDESASIAPR